MTLDEAIEHVKKIAEENQRIVDTGILFDNVTIDMLYCDDTEVIEEHLANYQKCAERHKQFAEWLKDYKRLLEQEPCEDAVSRQAAIRIAEQGQVQGYEWQFKELIKLPPVMPKTGHWIQTQEKDDAEPCILWECSECHKEFRSVVHKVSNYCPNCGVKMVEVENAD